MNLEQSDSFKDEVEKNSRHRKGVMLSIVLCGMMIALLFILIMFLSYQDSITEKLFIDDTQVTLSSDFYKKVDGVVYINVKQFAELLKYNYFNGEYGQYNENPDSCYIQNDFEIVALTANNKYFDKYLQLDTEEAMVSDIAVTLKNENGYKEKFSMDNEILYVNDQIYAPLDSMTDIFNVKYSWTEYRYRFQTFSYVVASAKSILAKTQYTQMSGYYENLKTVLYDYIIVGNGTAEEAATNNKENSGSKYGVISLKDGSEIAGVKYSDIRFVQNAKEFYVTVADGSMGIIDASGKIIINAKEYENISLLDDDSQLYLVKKDQEYGVINRLGKTIVYAENDVIGLDVSKYRVNNLENGNVLFNKCIPVEKNDKFGLYDINGECVLNMVYDGFGYSTPEEAKTSGNELSVLVLPSEVGINGIVINMNDLYGIYDVTTQKIILPCVASKIYAITKNGKTNYYYEFNNEQIDIAQWLVASGLNNIKPESKLQEESDSDTNTVSNTTTSNTVDSNIVSNEETTSTVENNDVVEEPSSNEEE